MTGLKKRFLQLANNPYLEFAIGMVVIVSGLWQLVYEFPEEIAAQEFEGHHALVFLGGLVAVNSLLRIFKGFEQTGKAAMTLSSERVDRHLRPLKKFMEHWLTEFFTGIILVLGGLTELFEEFLGIDRLNAATDNDYLWFSTLLVLGLSMMIKSLAGIIGIFKFFESSKSDSQLTKHRLTGLLAILRRPEAEVPLAIMILIVGICHELLDTTALGIEGVEAHHGLIIFGAHRLLKFSSDLSESMELAEEAGADQVADAEVE